MPSCGAAKQRPRARNDATGKHLLGLGVRVNREGVPTVDDLDVVLAEPVRSPEGTTECCNLPVRSTSRGDSSSRENQLRQTMVPSTTRRDSRGNFKHLRPRAEGITQAPASTPTNYRLPVSSPAAGAACRSAA